jgi:hypothetical protein
MIERRLLGAAITVLVLVAERWLNRMKNPSGGTSAPNDRAI